MEGCDGVMLLIHSRKENENHILFLPCICGLQLSFFIMSYELTPASETLIW